jgi:hypothetical protein
VDTSWLPSPVAGDARKILVATGANTNAYSDTKLYASGAVDPVPGGAIPSPTDGDRYYNTALKMWMHYDSTRAKWLSEETATFQFSAANNMNAGAYGRFDGDTLGSATVGFIAPYNGTVVSLTYRRANSTAATFDIYANGASVASVATSATNGKDVTLNGDFAVDDALALFNNGANNINQPYVVSVRVKWRV